MKGFRRIDNEFAAGCSRVSGGCVAYHGALQYYALQTQQFNTIYLHSPKRFRPFDLGGMSYEYHPLQFIHNAVLTRDSEGNPIAVTSLSQTVVDCIRHIDLAGGLEELLNALGSISSGQLKERDLLACLTAYDNASLWSRAGYLLSLFQDNIGLSDRFIETCRLKGGDVKNKLADGNRPLKYVPKWKLFVPENIESIVSKGSGYGSYDIF